jgi:hypothetical protein
MIAEIKPSAGVPAQAPAPESNSLLGGLQPPLQTSEKVVSPSDGKDQAVSSTPEVKADGVKDAASIKPTDAAQAVDAAPEKYADFKLPEGMVIDPVVNEKFTQIAKELNLSQEKAQKLVDLQTQYVNDAAKASQAEFSKVVEGWKTETLKQFGATNYEEALRPAGVLLNKFAKPEFREFLNDSKLGDHPMMAQFLVEVGKQFEQDNKTFDGKGHPGTRESLAKTLYPNHN